MFLDYLEDFYYWVSDIYYKLCGISEEDPEFHMYLEDLLEFNDDIFDI